MSYKIIKLTGDYKDRQLAANKAGVDLYIEAHYNSTEGAQGTEVLVTDTSGPLTRVIARSIAANISAAMGTRLRQDKGLKILKPTDRGYGNLAHARPPAMIVEPFFIDSFEYAEKARTQFATVADSISRAVRTHLPSGSTVALSLGHKGRRSRPTDKGAMGGNEMWEADLAALYLDELESRLSSGDIITPISDSNTPLARQVVESQTSEPVDQTPSPWSEEAWAWVEAEGYISGNPKGVVTREMLAVVLHRHYKNTGGV